MPCPGRLLIERARYENVCRIRRAQLTGSARFEETLGEFLKSSVIFWCILGLSFALFENPAGA
jgi:hypothetical protein